MKLLDDIGRCHDDGCKENDTCLRYLQRKDSGSRIGHYDSLFPYDISISDKCPNCIKTGDKEMKKKKTNRRGTNEKK